MIDRATFALQVRDALASLDDLTYLHGHPLALLLSDTGEPVSGDALHRLLVSASEGLTPPPSTPVTSPSLRHHKCLALRYLQGATPESVARQIGVSPRQARRDHLEAVQTLAMHLWDIYERKRKSPLAQAKPLVERGDVDAEDLTADTSLETELQHLGAGRHGGPVDLGEVLSDALAIVGGLRTARNVKIESPAPTGLPSVSLDRVILKQILVNVLGYVAEANPGSLVRLSASRDGQMVSLKVGFENGSAAAEPQDEDAAIQAEALLSTGRRILEAQGGILHKSGHGNGPKALTLSFPTEQVATVLVIDDNPDVARLFRRFLRGRSYAVIQASTGARALQIVREEQPDVVTLDLLMPSVDGWDVLRQLRSAPETRTIPIIVCSILPDKEVALRAGATAFLAKPVTQSSLISTLEPLLTPHRREAHLM